MGDGTGFPCWQTICLTEKMQVPQFCPAPVRRHTSDTERAPSRTAVAMSPSETTRQWQTITKVRLP